MSQIEKISIALSRDMLQVIRDVVQTGDYASTSEVVREALREWKLRRPAARGGAERVSESGPASMGLLYPLDPKLYRELAALCGQFQVRRLGLFGSVLRPDFAKHSDVDALVEFAPNATGARVYFDFQASLEALFGRPVDLVELAAMPDSRLKRHIERTQVVVYAGSEAA